MLFRRFVWERGLVSPKESEAFSFRRVQALQEHM